VPSDIDDGETLTNDRVPGMHGVPITPHPDEPDRSQFANPIVSEHTTGHQEATVVPER
jgi:hypothetical protein